MQQHLPILRRHQALHNGLLHCTERTPLRKLLAGGDERAQAVAESFWVVVFARVYEDEGDSEEVEENVGWGGVG
jgi:NAD-dependent oxidoreductase involved in siderophore biosynthesis